MISTRNHCLLLLLCFIILSNSKWVQQNIVSTDQLTSNDLKSIETVIEYERQDGLKAKALWGPGMSAELQSSVLELIEKGQGLYGNDYEKHTSYISTQLGKIDLGGGWNVIVFPNLKMDDSQLNVRGYFTSYARSAYEEKWANLYGVCKADPTLAYSIIKQGVFASRYINSQTTASGLPAEKLTAITNICQAQSSNNDDLRRVHDNIYTSLNKWDNHGGWSVVTTQYFLNGSYLDSYGTVFLIKNQYYTCYQNRFKTKNGTAFNLMIWGYY